jgi:hypothetical protein
MRGLPYPSRTVQTIYRALVTYFLSASCDAQESADAAEAVLAGRVPDWPANACTLFGGGVTVATLDHALKEGLFDLSELGKCCPGWSPMYAKACACYPGCGVCFAGTGPGRGCQPGDMFTLKPILRPQSVVIKAAPPGSPVSTPTQKAQVEQVEQVGTMQAPKSDEELTPGVEAVRELLRGVRKLEPEKVWATRKDLADKVRTSPATLDKAMDALPDNERPILRRRRK